MSDALRLGRSRGIPLDIVSRIASRNGVLEFMAKSNKVVDIRHLELEDFVRVARSLGASWVQIGDSLGIGARAACKKFGEPQDSCADVPLDASVTFIPFTPSDFSGSERNPQRTGVDDVPVFSR